MTVTLGFMPRSVAVPDVDHPGLLRAGPDASAPYARERVEHHECPATDSSQDDAAQSDLLELGFDTVDLTVLPALQQRLAQVRAAGAITDDDAADIRFQLDGAVQPKIDQFIRSSEYTARTVKICWNRDQNTALAMNNGMKARTRVRSPASTLGLVSNNAK